MVRGFITISELDLRDANGNLSLHTFHIASIAVSSSHRNTRVAPELVIKAYRVYEARDPDASIYDGVTCIPFYNTNLDRVLEDWDFTRLTNQPLLYAALPKRAPVVPDDDPIA